jgi:DUF1680 family protein
MALVELARETGEARYLEQAQYFLDARGRGLIGGDVYHQDHLPFREMERMAGHAVRALYLNCGATDLYAERGEPALRAALDRLWENMTARQLYVSGGLGSRYQGESFGGDYELPNERAYAETCAAIGNVMWNWRMLALEGDARYADLLELSLYNGFLVGLAADGKHYFYQNPLADDGTHRRRPWFECACCPTNVVRLLASLPGYLYSTSEEGLWVHLYVQGSAQARLADGSVVKLSQRGGYPWDGKVILEMEAEGDFSLFLRIPGWCEMVDSLTINGRPVSGTLRPGSYAEIRRVWQPGDRIYFNLPMPVRRVECHPYAAENVGRIALMRGPLLYCVEGADNPGLDPRDLVLPGKALFMADTRPDLLGGVVLLRGVARIGSPGSEWRSRLYRTVPVEPAQPKRRAVEMTAIPYFAWANRGPGPMQVWLQAE